MSIHICLATLIACKRVAIKLWLVKAPHHNFNTCWYNFYLVQVVQVVSPNKRLTSIFKKEGFKCFIQITTLTKVTLSLSNNTLITATLRLLIRCTRLRWTFWSNNLFCSKIILELTNLNSFIKCRHKFYLTIILGILPLVSRLLLWKSNLISSVKLTRK